MALVEDKEPIKCLASTPGNNLVDAAGFGAARAPNERGVRREKNAALEVFIHAKGFSVCVKVLAAVDHLAVQTKVVEIALSIEAQIARSGQPDVLWAASSQVVGDHAGNLASLSHASTVAQEKARTRATRQNHLVPLACILDAFELQRG